MPRLANRSRLRSAILSWPAALATVVVIQAVLSFGSKPGIALSTYTLIPYFLLLVLATGVASVNAVQRTLAQRPFWAFLAVGYGLWALDSWLWVYRELVLHQKIPDSSVADPVLFLHVIPFLAALATRPELGQASLRRQQTTLNFLLMLFFWVFLYAFLVFPFQFLPGNSIIYNLRYNVLYFGENLALMATLGALLLRAHAPWKSLYWHLLGATGVYTTGSLAANTAIDLGGYYPGHWTDVVIIIAICWFVWIPLRARQLEASTPPYVETKAAGLQATTVLAMLAVLTIPVMGAWELFQTEDWWMHRLRILVALCFMTLLALAAFIKKFAENLELKEEALLSDDMRRKSEERFRELLESVEAIIWEADAATLQVTFVSRGAERILGYSRRQWGEAPAFWADHLHPEDRERALTCERDVLEKGKALSAEYRMQAADGQYLWFRDFMHSVPGPDGKAERLRGIMVDITESREAEEALRQSEARLREALLAAQMGVWEWTVATDTVTWDENLYRIAGRDPKLPAPSYQEHPHIYAPGSWERLKAAVENALATGTPYGLDLELVRPDGSKRWLIGRGEALRDASGRMTQLRGTVQDITGRKRAEEALRTSEELYRVLFERNLAGIVQTTLDGRILNCNEASARIFGYASRDELMSRRASDLWFDPAGQEAFVARIQSEVTLSNVELRLRRKDGQAVWVLENLSMVKRGEGQGPILEATIFDITERKRAEEALRSLAARNEALLGSVPDIIMEVDSDKIYRWANPAGLEFFGEDVIGREAAHYFEGEQDTYNQLQPLFGRNENTIYVESWQRRRDGEKRLLAWWCRVLKDSNGNVTGALSTARDISERKRAEEALRESQEIFQKAFQASPDTMVIHSLSEGRHIDVNESYLRLIGHSREEVVGRTAMDLGFWWDLAQRDEYLRILRSRDAFVT